MANAVWMEGDQEFLAPELPAGLAGRGEDGKGGLAEGGKSALRLKSAQRLKSVLSLPDSGW